MAMTTTRATDRLATSYLAGGIDDADVWMTRAITAGQKWDWDAAEAALRAAYRALGAEPPGDLSGYHWHLGQTAIQIAARALRESHGG